MSDCGELVSGPGPTFDALFWRQIYDLLDQSWSGLSARVDQAAGLGFPWEPTTHPFVWVEDGRPLAHVGVLAHPVRLAGEDCVVAGLHAVCSHPQARGRGLVRRCLEAALEWVDARYDCAKLHTHEPTLYEKFGFRSVPLHRFVAPRSGGGGTGRRLRPSSDPADAELLRSSLAARGPLSQRFASLDPGWLVVIDAALGRTLDRTFVALPGGGVLAGMVEDGVLTIDDLIAAQLPTIDEVLAEVPERFDRVVYTVASDQLDPVAIAEPLPERAGAFMVRGTFPVLDPFGIGALWEH